ncbi:MAG: winged helix-turn-helix domain-containing protein [Acetobacteraceae bacterium]|nr:winged helix-turn-helix domain-containing protein [Acetobacteraceae bacterium]
MGSRALDILGVLVDRAGEVVSRAEILARVWPGTAIEDSNLNVQIAALRRALDHGGQDRVVYRPSLGAAIALPQR